MWDYIDVCNEGDVDAKWLTEADHDRIVAEAEARGWNAALSEVDTILLSVLGQRLPRPRERHALAAIAAIAVLRKPEVEG